MCLNAGRIPPKVERTEVAHLGGSIKINLNINPKDLVSPGPQCYIDCKTIHIKLHIEYNAYSTMNNVQYV